MADKLGDFINSKLNSFKQAVSNTATNISSGLSSSPVVQFGQTIGNSIAAPFVSNQYKQSGNILSGNVNQALKMAQTTSDPVQKARWMSLAGASSNIQSNNSNQFQKSYNKTTPQIAMEGLGTLATVYGGPKVTLPTLATTSLIGGGINKAMGGSFWEGAGRGAAQAPIISGVVGATNPLLSKFVAPIGGQFAPRIVSGGANVVQGLGMNASMGTPVTPMGVGLDFLTGVVGGKGQFGKALTTKSKTLFTFKKPLTPEEGNEVETIANRWRTQKDIGWRDHSFLDNILLEKTGLKRSQIENLTPVQKINELLTQKMKFEPELRGMGIADQSKGVIPEVGGKIEVKQSSSGNIYIKKGPNDIVKLPKTIQDDIHRTSYNGETLSFDRFSKTNSFLNKNGLEMSPDGKIKILSQSPSIPEVKSELPIVQEALDKANPKVGVSSPGVKTLQVKQQNMLMEQPTTSLPTDTQTPNIASSLNKPKLKVKSETLSFDGSLPQRKFAETVSGVKNLPKDVKDFLASQTYEPLKNKDTIKMVSKIVQRGDSQAISFYNNYKTVYGNATAMVMLKKLIDKGRWNEVNDLIEAVGPRFTKQGQEIQILSMFRRLSPEGAVRYAQKFIERANEANPRLKLKLTPENTSEITTLAKNLSKLPEGSREKIIATQQLLQRVTDLVPSSLGQKISSIQTMAQLLNPKTAIRNIVGNTIFTGAENVSDVVATGIDMVTSMITGKRSKTLPSFRAQGRGFITGLKQGAEDARLGIDTSGGVNSQFELNKKTFTGPILGTLEKTLNYVLRVPDRAAYNSAFEGSLNNQMRVAGTKVPTPEMMEVAHADGLYRTFQDNSRLSELFSGLKKNLNKIGTPDGKFGLGDLILKYPKTPANILSRGLDYSPIGFLKGMYQTVRPLLTGLPFDQKSFVETLSRAMVGTGLISAGYVLANNGIITGKGQKDYDMSSVAQTTGQGQFKLNVDALKRFFMSGGQKQETQDGDTLVSYDWAQPMSLSLAIGANTANGGKVGEGAGAVGESLQSGVDTLTGQPMVKGLTDFASNIKNKGAVGALQTAALDSASGFTPTLLNQIGNATDTTQRETYNPNAFAEAGNKVVTRIPGARNNLQPRVDVFGNEKVNYQGGGLQRLADIFINPAFVSTVKSNPAAKEVLDIYSRGGETKQAPRVAPQSVVINGLSVKPDPQQYTAYQKYIGTKTDLLFNNLLSDPRFDSLDDSEKAKLMSGLLSDVNDAAKMEIFGNNPKSVSGTVKYIIGLGGGNSPNLTTTYNAPTNTITPPTLTGNSTIDKKLTASYKTALANQSVKQAQAGTTGSTMDINKVYNYIDENGAYKTVDLTPPKYPTLTGNTLIDKKLKSAYYSSINSQINDVIKLGQNGQITQDQMIQMVTDLNTRYSSGTKKPKKVSIKAIKLKKMPKPKITKAKVTKLKAIKFKKPKIAKFKMKKPKLKYTANKFVKGLKAVSFG
jgi:hypothetical protein